MSLAFSVSQQKKLENQFLKMSEEEEDYEQDEFDDGFEDDGDGDDGFEDYDEEEEEVKEVKMEEEEFDQVKEPLVERFRALLLQSTRLSRKVRKAKLNGDETTVEYGRDVLDLIKLRVRVSAVEKLIHGPQHPDGAFTYALLCSSYAIGKMWDQATTSLNIAKDLMFSASSTLKSHVHDSVGDKDDIAYVLKAFDSTARKSSSGRSYVTTCQDINRYLSRSSADFKVCFDSTNSTDEIDFVILFNVFERETQRVSYVLQACHQIR